MHMKLKIFCINLWNNFTRLVPSAYLTIVLLHNFFINSLCLVIISTKILIPQYIEIPLYVNLNMVIISKFIRIQLVHPYIPASQPHMDK